MHPSINRRRRAATAGLCVTSAAAILLGACSASHPASIAHAQNAGTPTAASGSTGSASAQTAFQKYLASERAFAGCMRARGYSVSDPNSNGDQSDSSKEKAIQDPADLKKLVAASEVCKKKLLPDPRPETYPPESAKEFASDKKFAVCFRQHGVPNYPDPVRQTDPSLPNVQHYQAQFNKLPVSTKTYQDALNTCSVQITGHTGQG